MELNKFTIKKMILLLAVAALLLLIVLNFGAALSALGYIIGLFMPFITGCCMAFILNIPMKFIENRALRRVGSEAGGAWPKLKRPVSLLLTLVVVFGILTFVLAMIVPTLRDTVSSLIAKAPVFLKSVEDTVFAYASRFDLDDDVRDLIAGNGDSVVKRILSFLSGTGSWVAKNAAGAIAGVFSGLANIVLGFIFALYILLTKERLGRQARRLLGAYLPPKRAAGILDVAALSRDMFERFVAGQCLEAVIIGVLAGLCTIVINPSFALMLGVLIGFLSLIPVAGAILGVVIGALFLLTESLWQALAFVIVIIILQQLENHLIYPRVVGKSIGLPGIWVLLAVLLGGSIDGIIGILIGVPLCSILYSLLKRDTRKRLDPQPAEEMSADEEISNS